MEYIKIRFGKNLGQMHSRLQKQQTRRFVKSIQCWFYMNRLAAAFIVTKLIPNTLH